MTHLNYMQIVLARKYIFGYFIDGPMIKNQFFISKDKRSLITEMGKLFRCEY